MNDKTPSQENKRHVRVVVLCTSASGSPAFHTCELAVTAQEYDEGVHYDLAKENAALNSFEPPMIAFDANDEAGRTLCFGDMPLWLHNCGGWSEVNPDQGADFERARQYHQALIDDGELDLEDLPLRLMRYGLMQPAHFAEEMLERTAPPGPDEPEEGESESAD